MVARSIIWENVAKQQLKKLYQYIKQDSPQNALSVRTAIIDKAKQAAIYPESYSPDKYKADNDGTYRAFEIYHYRVSYRILEKQLIILRIRHTSQSPLNY